MITSPFITMIAQAIRLSSATEVIARPRRNNRDAESGCIHRLTEMSSHSRSQLSARSSSPLRCFSVRSLRRRGDLDPDQLLEAEIMPPVYPLPPLLAPPHHCKLCARSLSPG